MNLQHIAQIGSALAFQRGFYVAEINAGRDLYGNNAAAEKRSHEAEKALGDMARNHAVIVAALEEIELNLTQARLASNIGRGSSVKKADFLRGQCESIADKARAALQLAKEAS